MQVPRKWARLYQSKFGGRTWELHFARIQLTQQSLFKSRVRRACTWQLLVLFRPGGQVGLPQHFYQNVVPDPILLPMSDHANVEVEHLMVEETERSETVFLRKVDQKPEGGRSKKLRHQFVRLSLSDSARGTCGRHSASWERRVTKIAVTTLRSSDVVHERLGRTTSAMVATATTVVGTMNAPTSCPGMR